MNWDIVWVAWSIAWVLFWLIDMKNGGVNAVAVTVMAAILAGAPWVRYLF